MANKKLKKEAYRKLLKIVQEKIDVANSSLNATIEGRDNQTKSTAGDKHETGRAMMQAEQQRNEIQLGKAVLLKKELEQIDLEKNYQRVQLGALAITNRGHYFISIGIGKISVAEQNIYAVSLLSPIGKLLLNTQVGEVVKFQNKEIIIEEII